MKVLFKSELLLQACRPQGKQGGIPNCGALSWSHDHFWRRECLGLRVVGQGTPA